MAETGIYEHDADGQQPAARAEQHGYVGCLVLENLAYAHNPAGFAAGELASRFVRGWETSPGHRANLLNDQVMEAGLGVAHSVKTGAYYGVHILARPRTEALAFRVSNASGRLTRYRLLPPGQQDVFELRPGEMNEHLRCVATQLEVEGDSGHRLNAGSGDYFIRERNGQLVVEQGR